MASEPGNTVTLVAGGEPAHYVWRRAVFGVHLGDEAALIVLLSCGALNL